MKEGRKVKNDEASWGLKSPIQDFPHGWIQWKGTDVCIDLHCKCGEHFHYDGDFLYSVKCPKCKTCYALDGHIELIEIEEEPKNIKTPKADNDP